MDGRQRLGAALIVAGVGLALVGVAGTLGMIGRPASATGSSIPTALSATTPPASPGLPTAGPTLLVPTAPSTVAPTVAPTVATAGIVTAFFAELQAAIRAGTQETLADRLAAAVIDRYGRANCDAELAAKDAVPEWVFEILAVHDPAPWDYVTDDLTTIVADATTVDARVTGPDATGAITTVERELHVEIVNGAVFWFTDCGTPAT